jgi:Flp pilus assembly CpaF family ATPase
VSATNGHKHFADSTISSVVNHERGTSEGRNRLGARIRRYLYQIEEYLVPERGVTDIHINSDGTFWYKTTTAGEQQDPDIHLSEEWRSQLLWLVAERTGTVLSDKNPLIEGIIPETKFRIAGAVPPSAPGPCMSIRLPSRQVFTLDSYVREGRMTQAQFDYIIEAIETYRNFLVSGGTGAGKTALTNAIVNEIALRQPNNHLYVVEDTRELILDAVPNKTQLLITTEDAARYVAFALRFFPKRIIFGELRHSHTTYSFFEMCNTGHQGNFATLHADSAALALERGFIKAGEVVQGSYNRSNVSQAINVVIHMKGSDRGPVMNEIAKVIPQPGENGKWVLEYV